MIPQDNFSYQRIRLGFEPPATVLGTLAAEKAQWSMSRFYVEGAVRTLEHCVTNDASFAAISKT